jgi:hypothetical protein
METKNYNFVRDQFLGSIKFRLRNFFSFSHRFKTMQFTAIFAGMYLGWSFIKCVFFVLIGIPRWLPPQDIVLI